MPTIKQATIAGRANQSAVKPLSQKYSDLQNTQITFTFIPSCPAEGRLEIVTDAGQDAVDASGALDEGALSAFAKASADGYQTR
jgi:hypothetical protein